MTRPDSSRPETHRIAVIDGDNRFRRAPASPDLPSTLHQSGRHQRQASGLGQLRRLLLWMALGYLVFVIYGSLVPLNFRSMPLEDAVARFRDLPFLDLGIGSRADWVANLLLFIPLAFLWTALLAVGRGPAIAALVSLLVVVAGVALAVGIEFTQLFFPKRTVSQNDIMAESLGGVLGVIAWWAFGARMVAWYESWRLARTPAELAERLAWVYLVGIYTYGLLPLDLTLSPVELFHKWRDGYLHLIPFVGLPADPAKAVYQLVADCMLWAVLAFLWGIKRGVSRLGPWQIVFASALLLEFLQLFVYSRITDVTDLLTAALGGLLGARVALLYSGRDGKAGSTRSGKRISWIAFSLVLVWLGVLGTVFWYPFEFSADGLPLRERLDFLSRVPFHSHYIGNEFGAASEVLNKVLFFAPLGGLLAWWVSTLSWKWRSMAGFAAFFAILFSALGIEAGQMYLPEKVPDTTDAFLEVLGGSMGYVLVRKFLARSRPLPGGGSRRRASASGTRSTSQPSDPLNR